MSRPSAARCAPLPRPSTTTRRRRLTGGAVLGSLLLAGAAGADPGEPARPAATAELPKTASTPPSDPLQRIGSISVGHPHAGYLINGVRMPRGEQWLLSVPDQAWGTDETIAFVVHCIGRVNEQFPGSPKAIIGSISARGGGPLPPHKSHRTGRDVDVHFYLTRRHPKKWYEPATRDNLDRPRNWALLRAVVTETDVEMVLIDRSVQILLEEHALGIGEDPVWVKSLFHGSPGSAPLIKHVPGHTGHMHIRFFSPAAQRRGRVLYDQLVRQGHIPLPSREIVHEVERGDSLIRLARRYGGSVEDIQKLNQLDGTVIKVGQKLKIRERRDLRGARDPVVIPPRRLPPAAAATERRARQAGDDDATG